MADQKISDLAALTGADATAADLLPIVDVAPSATTKSIRRDEFFKNTPSLDVNGQINGKFTDVGTNTAAQALATNHVSQVTIDADTTLTTTVPPAGALATVIIITSGASSRTVTFGGGFASTGTLATGTDATRRFVISFVSDGTRLLETGRTTAITI
jgi:hypothetical protein